MIRRILIIPSWYPSDDDPIEGTFVEQQAVALARRYEVAVVAPRLRGWRRIARDGLGEAMSTEIRGGIPVLRPRAIVPIPQAISADPALLSYRAAVARGYRAAAAAHGKPDLLHAHVVMPAGWAAAHVAREQASPWS